MNGNQNRDDNSLSGCGIILAVIIIIIIIIKSSIALVDHPILLYALFIGIIILVFFLTCYEPRHRNKSHSDYKTYGGLSNLTDLSNKKYEKNSISSQNNKNFTDRNENNPYIDNNSQDYTSLYTELLDASQEDNMDDKIEWIQEDDYLCLNDVAAMEEMDMEILGNIRKEK